MKNWLYVFNSIVPLLSLITIGFYLAGLLVAWYGQNPYEWYVFKDNRVNVGNPYGWGYWLFMIGCLVLPQLLWLKKLRKNIWMTFFIVLFLSPAVWYERLVIYITSTYRDYLPSSWSNYYSGKDFILPLLLYLGSFVIVSGVVYFIIYKRKKLPFPSAILPYFLFFISYCLFHCTQSFN